MIVKAFDQTDDDVNKLGDIKKVVLQANHQRHKLGFHRNYMAIVVEAYGRKRIDSNILFRGANQETFKRVYEFPQRETLHADVGVVFIDITQPTGRSVDEMAVVGVCVDREAEQLDQTPNLTNRINELMC